MDDLRMLLSRCAAFLRRRIVGVVDDVNYLLFGVRPDDPGVFVSIIATVTVIALLVSWGPARRAASIDPMRALRTE